MLKRLFTVFLAVMLLCSLCCNISLAANQAGTFYTRTADPSTLDGWKALFGEDVLTTANVGTVWTDKTVTTGKPDKTQYPEFDKVTMANDQENFLITLSTLSATKSITGHETLPTDTVFVLDLSSSMYRLSAGNYYSTDVVGKMVDAVNNAIHSLLTLNPLNRVGVVVYYGAPNLNPQSSASHGKQLLALGNYAELDNGDYLQIVTSTVSYTVDNKRYTEESALVGINVNSNLKTRAGVTAISQAYVMPGNRGNDNIAGTYAQLGIEIARDMFMNADTTIPADADFQAGATRIPILVLMSDGEPTAADNIFHDVGDAIMGNNAIGERSPAETDFLTQLTAGLTREMLDMHYVDTTPLFYTLGLETNSISYDVMNPRNTDEQYAGASSSGYTWRTGRAHEGYVEKTTNTLPQYQNSAEQVNAKIKEYWTAILNNGSVQLHYLYSTGTYGGWDTGSDKTTTVQKQTVTVDGKSLTFPTSIEQKYYVDQYFPAADADALNNAFSDIVEEIHIQSAYYPTYVENGAIGMSGYLEFHDEIGDMMEVKKVHGLVRKATDPEQQSFGLSYFYYTGRQLAKHFDESLEDPTKLAELKVVLGKLLKVRFKLDDEETVQAAVNEIIDPANKMFYYNSDTDYGNIIRWYADKDEKYIALDTLTRTEAPSNAKYKMESYWYADTTSAAAMENYNSIICVKTEIATGKQYVTWSVPASMIPLVRYEVTLENKSLDNPGNITVKYTTSNPMRAVFEVGLRSEINKYNAVEYLTKAGYEPDENGVYTFYSNQWQVDDDGAAPNPSSGNADEADNTLSYFRPSEQNERYNIIEDTLLYDASGNVWPGSMPDSNDDVYINIPTFIRNAGMDWGTAGNAELSLHALKITSGFENIKAVTSDNVTHYYISNGTATHPDHQAIAKTENVTETYVNAFYETDRDETYVTAILGNNGTFSFVPDTGMTITKKAEVPTGENPPEFTFVITPQGNQTLSGDYTVTYLVASSDSISEGSSDKIAPSDNTLTVTIHAGETVYIPGLPAGNYTVEEQVYGSDGSYRYEVGAVSVGGEVRGTAAASNVTVTEHQMIEVEYTNTLVTTGSVKIAKTATSSVEGVDLSNADHAFTFEVALGTDNANKAYSLTYADSSTASMTTSADGKLTLSVKPDAPIIISGIANETSVTVTEVNIPNGYEVQAGIDNPQTETVSEGQTALFSYTNVYTPAKAPVNIQLKGTKTLTGRDWTETDSFSFQLQYYEESAGAWANVGDAVTATSAAQAFDLSTAMQSFEFNAPGTYSFRVIEVVPETKLPGIAYDTVADSFEVVITDTDVDGALEISEVMAVSGTTVSDNTESGTTVHIVDTAFTNTYTTTATSVTFSGTKTMEGRPLLAGEFSFELHETSSDFIVADGAQALQTVTYNTDGKYAFQPLTYAEAGTHYYVVREIGEKPGVTNAPEYHITVVVTDNYATGKLEATVTGAPSASELDFKNRYDAADNTGSFSGTKTLNGRAFKDGEFSFSLYASNDKYEVGEKIETVQNVADAFTFSKLDYDAAGTYYYLVMEDNNGLPGVTYDDTVYRIAVTVVDNTATGVLEVSATVTTAPKADAAEAVLLVEPIPLTVSDLNFTNTYDAKDTCINFSGAKSLQGRNLVEGEFSFTLYAADKDYAILQELETVTNDKDGFFAFKQLDYNAVGDYYYVVKEQAGNLAAMTYDPTEYRIHVAVTDVNAQLVAVATEASGASVTGLNFRNIHDETDATILFSGMKTLYGRPLTKDEFRFTLYAADRAFNAGQVIETVSNGADGRFAFSRIVYDKVGTYCYIVRENTAPASYIISDAAEYQIQVDVWNNNGVLVAECTAFRVADGERTQVDALAHGLSFTNHYVPSSVNVPLTGLKLYEGAVLTEGMFTFRLYAADDQFTPMATPIESVANAENGAFAFTPLTFNHEGVYRFVVVEDASLPMANVTYDTTVYHLTVTVTDNGHGSLVATTSLQTSDGLAADQLVFENFFYTVPDTGDHSSMEAYLALCLVSLAGMLSLMLHMRRRSSH